MQVSNKGVLKFYIHIMNAENYKRFELPSSDYRFKMLIQGQQPSHDVTFLALIPRAGSPRQLRPNDRDMALIDSVAPLRRIHVD